MKTRIIKLQSLKINLKDAFNKLAKKLSNRNTQITMIIKDMQQNNKVPFSEDYLPQIQAQKSFDETSLSQKANEEPEAGIFTIQKKVLKSEISEASQQNSDSDSMSVDICISNNEILPNVSVNSYKKNKLNSVCKFRRVSLDHRKLPLWPQNALMNKSRENLTQQQIPSINVQIKKMRQLNKDTQQSNVDTNFYQKIDKKQQINNNNLFTLKGNNLQSMNQPKSFKSVNFKSQQQSDFKQNKQQWGTSQAKNTYQQKQGNCGKYESKNGDKYGDKYELKISNILNPLNTSNNQIYSDSSQKIDDEQSLAQSLFIIENKLNDAIKFIQTNQIFELEEYLYEFKTKYTNISERIQIKWRLLMAHCKQSRKQYERASILYSQVLQLAEVSPKSLLIDSADIYHRLGICYTEIRRWNLGIMAFVEALNQLKMKGNTIKYAQCLNNLGTLYLYAGKIIEAEKCFVVSYDMKKKQHSPTSKNLLSSLLNIFQCNISAHNYDQASQILKLAENIFSQAKQNQMIMGGLLRRKGKLCFLKGDLQSSRSFYESAHQKLSIKYPYCLQYGQLMNNMGILNIENDQLYLAKNNFDRALIILNFYYTRDSIYAQMIKKNIELANNLIKKSNSMKLTVDINYKRQSIFG